MSQPDFKVEEVLFLLASVILSLVDQIVERTTEEITRMGLMHSATSTAKEIQIRAAGRISLKRSVAKFSTIWNR